MYLLRALAVGLVIVAVESAHGALRELCLAPLIAARTRGLKAGGDFPRAGGQPGRA